MSLMQYHLSGKKMSGRVVRTKPLDPVTAEKVLSAAAKIVGKDATVIELKKCEWRLGVKAFIAEFSEPTKDPATLTAKQWKKVAADTLDDMGALFTARDCMVLEALYRDEHEVSQDEVDAIVGKALPVSEG